MTKNSFVTAGPVALGITFGALAFAQEPVRPPTTPSARADAAASERLSAADEAFVRKAAAGGQAEIEMAMLALQKASSESVKQLAQRIEDDHKKANSELMSIATNKGLSVDAKPTAAHLKEKARIQKLDGMPFDRAYLDLMLKDHHTNIQTFEKQAHSGEDSALKAFAARTLPELKQHLKMTMEVQKASSSQQH